MGTIVRNMEGKMVNLSSRLPFNLHHRVLHDSLGSVSRSNSVGYGGLDYFEHPNDSSELSDRHLDQENPREDAFTYTYHPSSRSHSVSDRRRSASEERETVRPAAVLNLRLVGVTETERGRALERTVKPIGLGGGSAVASTSQSSQLHNPIDEINSGSDAGPVSINLIDPKDMVLSSWYE
ncbi:hypothetical protein AGABI2DRAFT_188734 [Agaricus bisporus var. bisporus H97]|uniref:hypothetical protein n=1 Tax=Agaricus bisporus var. bisporus (strain H97 / ATCC MYA-4626 / FGSC 10389) TaxID=936046 RepID=UPI00029F5C5B|nr:hypothetical protein AGABI2DRAFT_188734 [Agaricus bisporus var. bisporus H97]EKV42629.1 hypothetical protein AGABI2DRAFT_188734 [Agaricus bisporus var. bisporus H97]